MITMNSLRKSIFSSRRSPRSRVATRCLVALCALAAGSSASGLERFVGQWNLDSAQSDRIDDAIETCIAGYPKAAKEMTRERLRETNALVGTLFISAKGGGKQVLIGYEQVGSGTIAPLDGTEVASNGGTGEEMTLTVVLQGDVLVERFQAYNGTRTNTYSLTTEGNLQMEVKVESPEMPTVLSYKLDYSRSSNTAVHGKPIRRSGIDAARSAPRGLDGRVLQNLSARNLGSVVAIP
jgi:hypothetical protein